MSSPFNGYDAFAQIDAVHQSHSLATTDQLSLDLQGNSIAYDLPAFHNLRWRRSVSERTRGWCRSTERT